MGLWDRFLSALLQKPRASIPPTRANSAAPTDHPNAVALLKDGSRSSSVGEAADWWVLPEPGSTLPVAPHRPELSAESRAIENTLVSHFDGHDLTLPAMPVAPDRVLRELRRTDCDFADVAQLISEDQVLTAAVLRTANSPFYRAGSPITSIKVAVPRLGIRTLRTLMMHVALQSATLATRGCDRRRAEALCSRALAGALIMEALAPLVGIDEEDAFLLGLLHDIGNIVVLRIASTDHAGQPAAISDEEFEFLCYEAHQEFGELVANAWKLPERVTAVIRQHHSPPAPDDPLRRERWAVMLSDMICAMLGYAPREAYEILDGLPARNLDLLANPAWPAFLKRLPTHVEQMLESA